ncbi:MAG: thiamine diphosphokinase [Synergistaceae bacterium]|nr:thiamine diphosphokinase [Synergistaceae bacterium]
MYQAPVFSSREARVYSPGSAGFIQDRKTLFLLGGRAPGAEWLADLAGRNRAEVWAVDSGVAACRAAGLVPAEILGDRDSASPGDWEWALSKGARERRYDADKDRTDFQLALSVFEKNGGNGGAKRVLIVSGCFGGAFDHLLSVFDTLASGDGDYFRCMTDDREGAFFLRGGESAMIEFVPAPEAVSLLSVSETCRVGLSGVKWPLAGEKLERKYPWTVSNETLPDADGISPVTVICEDGQAALYWRYRAVTPE